MRLPPSPVETPSCVRVEHVTSVSLRRPCALREAYPGCSHLSAPGRPLCRRVPAASLHPVQAVAIHTKVFTGEGTVLYIRGMRLCEILQGDCCAVLETLPAASVHCIVTSPPY
jgi:hypothetical protein